jgi:hypothetical protein
MVKLEDEGDVAFGQTFDYPELPQWPGAIERLRGDVRHQIRENSFRPWGWRLHPVDVAANIELRIVDPDRMVETERHRNQPAS